MGWQGSPDLVKEKLTEVGADREGDAWRIGPEMMEPIPGEPSPPSPIAHVLGDKLIHVSDHAVYYVNGKERSLCALMEGAPQGIAPSPVTDAIVIADVAEALAERDAACTCTLSAGSHDPVAPWERDPDCPVHRDG